MDTLSIAPVNSSSQIATVARLAATIWREYYPSVIGSAQVEYMLEKFQSENAIHEQIANGDEYFVVATSATPCGYFAYKVDPAGPRLFLSKFYILKGYRAGGIGRKCLLFIEQRMRGEGIHVLHLTVNKNNPALESYRKLGFSITSEVITDIGGGYVMDDFRLEKNVR